MEEKTVAQKLQIMPGRTVVFMNEVENAADLIGPLPEGTELIDGATVSGPVDIVIMFARSRAELEEFLPRVKAFLKSTGMGWILYYKGTSSHKTDLNRDSIDDYAGRLGYKGVAMASVNDDWTAFRFRLAPPVEE